VQSLIAQSHRSESANQQNQNNQANNSNLLNRRRAGTLARKSEPSLKHASTVTECVMNTINKLGGVILSNLSVTTLARRMLMARTDTWTPFVNEGPEQMFVGGDSPRFLDE
jgi:hypothetical protein